MFGLMMKYGSVLLKVGLSAYRSMKVFGKNKIFCVGLNKTGTTSLEKEMKHFGYIVGSQRQAELLFDDWVKRDFKRIIRYCYTAQFFQDIPFSYPYTYIVMDQVFPKSKFILTIRDSAEEWYSSLIHFHGKLWGKGNVPPTANNLKNSDYIYKGFPYHARVHVNNVPEYDPYKKEILIDYYDTHKNNVIDYFRHRPDDLLVINLKDVEAYPRFCEFLGQVQEKESFFWENKTEHVRSG